MWDSGRARHRCTKTELRDAREVAATLAVWNPEGDRVFKRSLPLLVDLLRADFAGAYLPVRTVDGWSCAFAEALLRGGLTQDVGHLLRKRLLEHVASAPKYLRLSAVPRAEQNRVISFRQCLSEEDWANYVQSVASVVGISREHHDLHVLCTHRGASLGWCGVYQREPFLASQRAMFQKIVPALRDQALLEKTLGLSELQQQGLHHALLALPQPAYLLDATARVVATNERGRQRIDGHVGSRYRQFCEWIRAFRAHAQEGNTLEVPGATVTVVRGRRLPEHYFITERAVGISVEETVAMAARHWSLTSHQAEVLQLVTAGKTTKAVAAQLGCGVRTVEHVVATILRKSGQHNRAGLVASLLGGRAIE